MPDFSRGTESSFAWDKWLPSLYFVIGQAGWFACVLTAARGEPGMGISFAAVLVTLHLLRVSRPLEEMKFLAAVIVIGGLWESILVVAGLLAYPGNAANPDLAPGWIVALWGLFAAQFNTTYQWLKPHIKLAAVLGAIAGPLSFRGGAALGAVHFAKPIPATVALAIGWAALLPVLILLSQRWDGVRRLTRIS